MTSSVNSGEPRVYLVEMARLCNRRPHSIRRWIREGELPRDLRPKREGGRRVLYWLPEQVDPMIEFAREMHQRQGFPHSVSSS